MIGHIYLVQLYRENSHENGGLNLSSLQQSMMGATLFSLFFSILGTILGGIWADQSWGRFWGWDPKENGALLICLWLLALLHGKLAGYLKPKFYALFLSLTSIVVAFAWFGVNLLNVGLHSYGFTNSLANNLIYFSLFEILFALAAFILIS
jgi:ABC-type transport system involved in cytochrome c biogenesis permease subunit